MTDRIIIIGGGSQVGKTAALLDALREHGCVVVVADRMPPPPDPMELGAVELRAALLCNAHLPELPPLPLPVLPLPVPKRWAGPILPPLRTGKRHREQRTKRGR
jgi:NAD(P)-dependent dehydrogenase (short-subunit alcohol dehydrogenase family)